MWSTLGAQRITASQETLTGRQLAHLAPPTSCLTYLSNTYITSRSRTRCLLCSVRPFPIQFSGILLARERKRTLSSCQLFAGFVPSPAGPWKPDQKEDVRVDDRCVPLTEPCVRQNHLHMPLAQSPATIPHTSVDCCAHDGERTIRSSLPRILSYLSKRLSFMEKTAHVQSR
ncbi:hypothetical protein BV25DRAFT_1027220 [Artomyces pyxidatus]|uniref:Uncharacterized protein n=1 Tax=Artomyces pyxidatus TaxID=48021 RepID=A0ACB8ST86_9AGAM|nr:hypothetical protein BV25DRAFT_1027220 [Artomyces pyxidatus]